MPLITETLQILITTIILALKESIINRKDSPNNNNDFKITKQSKFTQELKKIPNRKGYKGQQFRSARMKSYAPRIQQNNKTYQNIKHTNILYKLNKEHNIINQNPKQLYKQKYIQKDKTTKQNNKQTRIIIYMI